MQNIALKVGIQMGIHAFLGALNRFLFNELEASAIKCACISLWDCRGFGAGIR